MWGIGDCADLFTHLQGRHPGPQEYTGLMSWLEGPVRYTVVHSTAVAVLFVDTDPADAIVFHRDLLGSIDPKMFFRLAPPD